MLETDIYETNENVYSLYCLLFGSYQKIEDN